jgi:hypothetical protein
MSQREEVCRGSSAVVFFAVLSYYAADDDCALVCVRLAVLVVDREQLTTKSFRACVRCARAPPPLLLSQNWWLPLCIAQDVSNPLTACAVAATQLRSVHRATGIVMIAPHHPPARLAKASVRCVKTTPLDNIIFAFCYSSYTKKVRNIKKYRHY